MLRYESHESSLERAFWEATPVCANNSFPGIVDAPGAGTAVCLEVSQAGMGLQRGRTWILADWHDLAWRS